MLFLTRFALAILTNIPCFLDVFLAFSASQFLKENSYMLNRKTFNHSSLQYTFSNSCKTFSIFIDLILDNVSTILKGLWIRLLLHNTIGTREREHSWLFKLTRIFFAFLAWNKGFTKTNCLYYFVFIDLYTESRESKLWMAGIYGNGFYTELKKTINSLNIQSLSSKTAFIRTRINSKPFHKLLYDE